MNWPLVSLILGVLASTIVGYLAWSFVELERARDKRASLRLEMERGTVATFEERVRALEADAKAVRLRLDTVIANVRR